MKSFILLCIVLLSGVVVNAQNIGIGTTTPTDQLHTTGNVRLQKYSGTSTRLLQIDSSGRLVATAAGAVFSNTTPQTITDNGCAAGTGISSSITISGQPNTPIQSSRIAVKVNITHPYVSDLRIYLFPPSINVLTLANGNGGSGDNFTNTIFTDQAAGSIGSGVAPFTGQYKPLGGVASCNIPNTAISSFSSIGFGTIIPNGTWTLKVFDASGSDIGMLNDWSISFTGPESIVTSDENNFIPKLTDGNFTASNIYQAAGSNNIGVGTSAPNSSAILDISAGNKGLLIPRVNLLSPADVSTIPAPAIGLLVQNTNGNAGQMPDGTGLYMWANSWSKLLLKESTNSTAGWTTRGNSGTNADSNFVGTRDNVNVIFKRNNIVSGLLGTQYTALGVNAYNPAGTGIYNAAIGNNALNFVTAGSYNAAVGSFALRFDTSGSDNTAMGYSSLVFNRSGSANTAVGTQSLSSNITGYSNVAIGAKALAFSNFKNNLVAVGDSALYNNGSGSSLEYEASFNTAVGSKSLYENTRGYSNTATGSEALYANTLGLSNSGYGAFALRANIDGDYNTATGANALRLNTTGSFNVANGFNAIASNTAGSENTAMGYNSLNGNKSSGNTALGFQTLNSNITGYSNVAVGTKALVFSNFKNNLVAVGDSALYNNGSGSSLDYEASGNTAIGSKVLYLNSKGWNNTAVGFEAMYVNNLGSENTAIGHHALYSNGTGVRNTAVGDSALYRNSGGSNNTAVGYYSLRSNVNNGNQTAVGAYALRHNDAGVNNVAVGFEAGYFANNSYGTYIGYQAGRNTNGVSNTYIGWGAGTDITMPNTSGDNNVFIGVRSGQGLSNGSENIAIGNLINTGHNLLVNTVSIGHGITNTATNTVVLGNSNIVKWGFGTNAGPSNILEFNNSITTARLTNGGVWTNASDRNVKTNFSELNGADVLKRIMQLPVTRWSYKKEDSNITHIGPMAQDFYSLFNTGADDKTISTIDPSGVALIGVQELKNEIDELKKEIAELKKLIKK